MKGRRWIRRYESADPVVRDLLEAIREVRPVRIRYCGGSEPHRDRLVLPGLVFRDSQFNSDYCLAWCSVREACRLFRTDRIRSVTRCDECHFPYYRATGELEAELQFRYIIRGDRITPRPIQTNHHERSHP